VDDAEVRRLVTALRVALPEPARVAEIRVSLLPGMVLVRVNWDPGVSSVSEARSFVSPGGPA